MFKPESARRSLRRYRKRGLDELERRMVASAVAADLVGARVLEIGGGIGAIQVELLDAGAATGEVVELVDAYEPYARELAHDRGLDERSSFQVADILERPESVEPADIVVLNRVVCCSPDGVALAAEAARHTQRQLVLSFPRDVVWVRAAFRVLNAFFRIRRSAFRVFLHRPGALVAAAEAEGLRRMEGWGGTAWEFIALQRGS